MRFTPFLAACVLAFTGAATAAAIPEPVNFGLANGGSSPSLGGPPFGGPDATSTATTADPSSETTPPTNIAGHPQGPHRGHVQRREAQNFGGHLGATPSGGAPVQTSSGTATGFTGFGNFAQHAHEHPGGPGGPGGMHPGGPGGPPGGPMGSGSGMPSSTSSATTPATTDGSTPTGEDPSSETVTSTATVDPTASTATS